MYSQSISSFAATCRAIALGLFFASTASPFAANAEIDGHGPDFWRVDGVAPDDTLNMRMGPGTNYPVIGNLAHDEGRLRQITCVPFFGMGAGAELSDAQRAELPPRWCLMQHSDRMRAGWVAQRYITPDNAEKPLTAASDEPVAEAGDDMIDIAEDLVRALYEMHSMAMVGMGPSPLEPVHAERFFFTDIVEHLRDTPLQADPLVNAQDFDGSINEPYRDPQSPMLRGMITILVDFTNFGQAQRAVVRLRADTSRPGAPVRIMRIEHDGWTFP